MTNIHKICSRCKKPLDSNAPDGLCPECLLQAGLGTDVDMGPDSRMESGQAPFIAPSVEVMSRLFPQCEILSFIGQGGMGAVYKARQKQLDRVVALKILPPGIGIDAAFAERFTREARALAKLNHPGIVTLYEFGRADGLFYFLMEFVDGVNLSELLGTGRVSARESLAIVPQICDALQYAHDQGIVHRDIKPENILLDRRGRVKVADFGLAKLTEPGCEPRASENAATAATLLTDAGKAMGTPQYMAPEQRDHPNEVDHRADIYALGVVFYQMLTGKLPNQPIEPPSTKVQIDVRLDEVVLRALERKPERRYQQASDLKTQVETVATVMGSGAAKTSPSFYKRMFAAITVVLCLVGAIYFQSRAHDFWTYQKSYLGNGTPQSPLFSVYVGGVGRQPTIAYIVRFSDRSTAPENILDISQSVTPQFEGRTRDMDRWRSDFVLLVGRRVGEKIRIPLDTKTAQQWFGMPYMTLGDFIRCQKFWNDFVSPRIAEFDRNAKAEQLLQPVERGESVQKERQRINREKFEHRTERDRKIYTPKQLTELEGIYFQAVSSTNWASPKHWASLKIMLEKFPEANRTGCALLDLTEGATEQDTERYLIDCIRKHNDCFYGDGSQVGALARFKLANYYDKMRQSEKAEALYKEIKENYSDSIDHQGQLLTDLIK